MRTKAVPPPDVRLFTEYFREAGYYVTNNSFTDFQVPTPTSAFDDCSDTAHWRNRPDKATPFFATFHGMITHESQIYLDEEAFAIRTGNVSDDARHDPAKAPLPPYYPDTDVFRRSWARYNDLITEMDHWAGNILAQLEEDGQVEETIVVFWSDHGLGMPRGKRWANDSGLHEPLIVRWPGHVDQTSINTNVVHLMDLAPTMLRLCGLDIPPYMHATPFLHPDGSQIESPNEYAFAGRDRMGEMEDMSRSVRDERYRYIRHFHPDRGPMQHCDYPDSLATWREMRRINSGEADQRAKGLRPNLFTELQRSIVAPNKPEEELYDLIEDPHETRNLADVDGHADVLARFREALAQWQSSYGDLGLVPENDLLEEWRPGGLWPTTSAPTVEGLTDVLNAWSATEGAHTVWTADPPGNGRQRSSTEADKMGSPGDAIGAPQNDGRLWKLLCKATPPVKDADIWIKACRLGYLESQEVLVPAQ